MAHLKPSPTRRLCSSRPSTTPGLNSRRVFLPGKQKFLYRKLFTILCSRAATDRYAFNGIGVGLGGLIGFAIGHIKGQLQSWRYEFLIVGAVCAAWGASLAFTIGNSPTTNRWFTHDERLMIIARLRRNQTGVEGRKIRWDQIREAFLDYKTWIFFSLGMIGVGANLDR